MLSTQSEGTPLTHAEPAHHLVRLLGRCGHAVRNSIQPPMTHKSHRCIERVQPATIPERAASILKPRPRIGFIQPTKGYGAYGSMPLAFITATAEGDARNLAKASAPFGSRALARTPATMRNFTPGRSGSGSSICTPGSVLKLRRCATPI